MPTSNQLTAYFTEQLLVERELDDYRGLYAMEERPVGVQLLGRGSRPMASVLSTEARGERCSECLKVSGTLLQCSRCHVDRYCGQDCQIQAWKGHHRAMCGRMGDMPMETVLLWRTAMILVSEPPGEDVDLMREAFLRLEGGEDVAGGVALHEATNAAAIVMRGMNGRVEMGVLTRASLALRSSAFALSDAQSFPYPAIASYPLGGALLNHSCVPNAITMTDGSSHQIIRVGEHIGKGEEVLICYVDPALPTSDRRAALLDGYHFYCQCPRCSEGEGEGVDGLWGDGGRVSGVPFPSTVLETCMRECILDAELLDELYIWSESTFYAWRRRVAKKIKEAEPLAAGTSYPLPLPTRLIPKWNRRFEVAIDGGRYAEALDTAILIALIYLLLYPRRDALCAMQWLAVGKCAHALAASRTEGREGYIRLGERALHLLTAVIPVSFAGPIVETVHQQMEDLRADLDALRA